MITLVSNLYVGMNLGILILIYILWIDKQHEFNIYIRI